MKPRKGGSGHDIRNPRPQAESLACSSHRPRFLLWKTLFQGPVSAGPLAAPLAAGFLRALPQ